MARPIDGDKLQTDMMEMVASGLYDMEDMIDAVIEAPTISPDDVRGVGRWLNDVGEFGFPEIPCSVCGYKSGHYGFKFCPNCGAKMEVREDD